MWGLLSPEGISQAGSKPRGTLIQVIQDEGMLLLRYLFPFCLLLHIHLHRSSPFLVGFAQETISQSRQPVLVTSKLLLRNITFDSSTHSCDWWRPSGNGSIFIDKCPQKGKCELSKQLDQRDSLLPLQAPTYPPSHQQNHLGVGLEMEQ